MKLIYSINCQNTYKATGTAKTMFKKHYFGMTAFLL